MKLPRVSKSFAACAHWNQPQQQRVMVAWPHFIAHDRNEHNIKQKCLKQIPDTSDLESIIHEVLAASASQPSNTSPARKRWSTR